jgi:diaminopimelate decarboxylase
MFREIPDHLEIKNGKLFIGGLDAEGLAATFGTPLYVYNGTWILENYRRIHDALQKYSDREVRVYYAAKANTSLAVMKLLADAGAWVDVVSPFEARLALGTNFRKEKVLFTGTSVSNRDLESLVDLGVMINIDSFSQLRRLAMLGRFDVAIRWNPGEGAGLHDYVITAGKYIKFGIPENRILRAFSEAIDLNLYPVGLHQHIGSGWLNNDVDIFLDTVHKTLAVAEKITGAIGYDLDFIDFGGGPGIPYRVDQQDFPLEKYSKGICERVKQSGLGFKAIAIEPGRYIVGDAGVLLTEINTVEEKGTPLIGLDAGFGTLVRPMLYNAYHNFVICGKADRKSDTEFMVAGNLCESGDVFHDPKKLRPLPTPDEGDILATLDVGAYGYVMGSSYNMRPLPAEVMVQNGKARLIRERATYEDLTAGQSE